MSTQPQQQHKLTPIEFAVIQCRNELVRLAKLIERNPPSSSSVSPTSDNTTSKSPQQQHHSTSSFSSSFFDSISNFVSEHKLGFGEDDHPNNTNTKNSNNNNNRDDNNKHKTRELEKEYLALAKSCQQAAKVSDLEAAALRDSIKMIKALKEAAEEERDKLEDKLDTQRTEMDKLKQLHFQKSVGEQLMSSRSSSSRQMSPTTNTSTNNSTQQRFDEFSPQQQKQYDSKCVGTADLFETLDPLNDSNVLCQECGILRERLAQEEARFKRREETLESEIQEREKRIIQLDEEWKKKVQRVMELEEIKSEAKIRRTAAAFIQKSAQAEAANAKKLIDSEMQQLEYRNSLSKALKEIEELKLDHDHAMSEARQEISTLTNDNKELKRLLHKISAHNNEAEYDGKRTKSIDEWTQEDDKVAGEDAKGAFHAWLHASNNNNNTNNNNNNNSAKSSTVSVSAHHLAPSSGIIEAARRLLSSKLATSGHVSIEDETVARALHHTNETLRDALEENMKLQLRVKELEEKLDKKK